jgi:hypothetical protein
MMTEKRLDPLAGGSTPRRDLRHGVIVELS